MEIKKEDAIRELGYDTISSNPYDLLKAVGVNYNSTTIKPIYIDETSCGDKEKWQDVLTEFSNWLTTYQQFEQSNRLCLSDLAITKASETCVHGVLLVVNGMNGMTQMSRQSLKHIMDIVSYLEDHYGARAFLAKVSSHSDVYYYMLSFVIWSDHFENKANGDYANLKPLYLV